jgi:hypothetical protein
MRLDVLDATPWHSDLFATACSGTGVLVFIFRGCTGDATQLGQAAARDVLSEETRTIPAGTNSCLMGWHCTDASLMNKHAHSKANRYCVLAGGLRAGGVCRGIVDWCTERGGDLDFLGNENVPCIGRVAEADAPDNFTAAAWLLDTECDIWTKPWL